MILTLSSNFRGEIAINFCIINIMLKKLISRPPMFVAVFLSLAILISQSTFGAVKEEALTETITVSDQIDIVISKYPAPLNGQQQLILWIAPNFGFQQRHNDMSRLLNREGFEVWMADINEALFLPHNSSAMREVNARYVADLIKVAHQKTGKQVVLMSGSYGAIPVLRGARQWLFSKPESRYLLGAILFSPNVYQKIPPLGVEPKYLPIVYATTIPVIIFQGSMNSNRWQLDKIVDALRSNGGFVYSELIPETIDLFYGEEHPAQVEKYFHYFASNMKNQIEMLIKHTYPMDAKPIESVKTSSGSGLDSQLKPFKGSPKPSPITLKDINGKSYAINNYRNRVVLVNFWATWCTPCIKEIPSLNNLREKMKEKPFQLISINYAETPETIRNFMKGVNVEFPVLVDEQGLEAAKWKVIVFPSTFVVGMDGLIHYGVNAGIEWDTQDVINVINQLMTIH